MQTRYDYRDGDGRIVCSVIRTPEKEFYRVRKVDGKDIHNWDGIQVVPFNLPEIINKPAVFLVEGEKDVLKLRSLQLPATTIPGGSNAWNPLMKKQPDFCRKYFGGKTVIIIPDNDDPGKKFMDTGAQYLTDGGAIVHSLEICEGMQKGADISDWLDKNEADQETLLSVMDGKVKVWEPPAATTSILDQPIQVSDELRKPTNSTEYDIHTVFNGIVSSSNGSWSSDHRTYNCNCPAHQDKRASLSVSMAEDKILLYCHKGCDFNSICDGLGVKPHHTFKTGRAHLESRLENVKGPEPGELEKVCKEILETDEPEDFTGIKPPILDDYVKGVTTLTDAHPVIIYATALAALGAQAQTRFVIPKGSYYVRLFPNIWTLAVAESGTFKTTALNAGAAPRMEREREIVGDIIDIGKAMTRLLADGAEADDPEVAQMRHQLEELEGRRRRLPDKSSWEACIDRIDSCGGGIWTLSEFGAWLSTLEKSYNQGFKQTITELYDVPENYEEATRNHGTRLLQRPFISISGVSTIEFLSGLVSQKDAATGFLARFLLLRPPPRHAVPDALPSNNKSEQDLESYHLLQEVYRQIASMTVPIEFTIGEDATMAFNDYHKSMFDRFYKMKESEREWMEPFIKRFGANALKVAMVSQFLINSSENVISGHAMMAGISLASYSEICTRFLFRRELGETDFQRKARVVIAFLANHNGTCTRRQLYSSKTLGGGAKDYDYVLRSLIEQGRVIVEAESEKWKPHSKVCLVNA